MAARRGQGRDSPLSSTLGLALGSLPGWPERYPPSFTSVLAVELTKGGHPQGFPAPLLTHPPCLPHSPGGEV